MHVEGTWATRIVMVDGKRLYPYRSQRVWNHSPDWFSWGYGGSGPAQLSLALLLAAGLKDERAVRLHQPFKWTFIAPLPQANFVIEIDLPAWVQQQEETTT